MNMQNKPTYNDAVMKEVVIKRTVVQATSGLTELSAMAMNRHERRKLARVNGLRRIEGSMRPFTY